MRALVVLAQRRDRAPMGVGAMAKELGTPKAFLAKVMRLLTRAGLVSGERGLHGGYTLRRDPRAITLEDVLRATGDHMSLARCFDSSYGCPRTRDCPARPAWERVAQQLKSALRAETIASLADGGGRRCGTTRKR